MLPSFDDYCVLIADLPNQYDSIRSSTLTAFTIGPLTAEIEGEVIFAGGYVLSVWELLDLSSRSIRSYSYELDWNEKRIWWYDPTDHPGDPTLDSTAPHHKHVEPDIKHHRIPAPNLSFAEPNILSLVREVESLLES